MTAKQYVLATGCFAIAFLVPPAMVGQTKGTGRVEIKTISTYSGSQTLQKPTSIVVYDFPAAGDDVKLNSSALSRVRTRASGNGDDQRSDLARRVSNDFAEQLVTSLRKTGLPVSRSEEGASAPNGSLAVQGDFSTIDEGNRARRMAVGLGAGASKVEAHVECTLMQGGSSTVITKFKATSKSSRKPGAAETMGAGAAPEVAAAAGGVTEMKQGAEGDADRMAKAIAKEINKTMKARGWAE